MRQTVGYEPDNIRYLVEVARTCAKTTEKEKGTGAPSRWSELRIPSIASCVPHKSFCHICCKHRYRSAVESSQVCYS